MPKVKCSYKPCGKRFERGTGRSHGMLRWCSEDCHVKHAMSSSEKGKKIKDKIERQEDAQRKKEAKLRDKKHQLGLTQDKFNEMIRLLDLGKRCPTCDEQLVIGAYDAGHVRTVAACPSLRLDARACFGQCRKCNGSGTIRKRVRKTQEVVSDLYRAWIRRSFGIEYYDWLYGPHALPKWTCEQLIAMRAEFAEEIRRLKAGLSPSKDWREFKVKEGSNAEFGLPLQHPSGERGNVSPDEGQAQVASEGLGEG